MEEEVEEVWIEGEESAKAMLERVLRERPLLLLLPPLHRVPLRFGNVVELLGPSPSAKTHILIQAAVSCILPKEWNGVTYGGLEHLVMFIDLDCRFDVLRLLQSLRHRIMEANVVWVVRMEAYLDANDLWEAAEQVYEVPPLPDNPTLAQIKNQKERKQRKSIARATLFAAEIQHFYQNNDAKNSQGNLGFFEARIRRKCKDQRDASAEFDSRI
ncbi:unnamed protein product [Camellia sinensis]